jgi:hypothetical protein
MNLNLCPRLNRWLLVLGIVAYFLQPVPVSRETPKAPQLYHVIFQD